jgi:hypothetical protein
MHLPVLGVLHLATAPLGVPHFWPLAVAYPVLGVLLVCVVCLALDRGLRACT